MSKWILPATKHMLELPDVWARLGGRINMLCDIGFSFTLLPNVAGAKKQPDFPFLLKITRIMDGITLNGKIKVNIPGNTKISPIHTIMNF